MNTWDVIVVGAGPVGSYLSGCLSERGYRVLLLDRKGKTGRQVCAGVIGAEAFQKFPLPRSTVLYEVDSVTMVSPSGKRLRHTTREPMAYVVDRVEFDRAMLRRALGRGVEFFNLSRVVGVEKKPRGIEVVCRDGARGDVKTYQASLVVFATGYNPGLLTTLGLPDYPGAMVGIQTVGTMKGVEGIEVYLGREVAPGGFAWLVPMGDGRVRIGLVVDRDARSWFQKFLSFPGVADRLVGRVDPVRASWIPRGPVARTFGDGFLVVGEAAGQVKATTYGGVYYGLLCALEAINVIEEAFAQGVFGEDVLSGYQEAWHRVLLEELEVGARLREKVEVMEDSEIDDLFVFLGSDGFLPRLRATVRFDWHGETIRFFAMHVLGRFVEGKIRFPTVIDKVDSG